MKALARSSFSMAQNPDQPSERTQYNGIRSGSHEVCFAGHAGNEGFLDRRPESGRVAHVRSAPCGVCSVGRYQFTPNRKEFVMIVRAVIVGILIVAFAAPVFADQKSRGVDRREHRQKERIKQGGKNGELIQGGGKGVVQVQRESRAQELGKEADGAFTEEERKAG